MIMIITDNKSEFKKICSRHVMAETPMLGFNRISAIDMLRMGFKTISPIDLAIDVINDYNASIDKIEQIKMVSASISVSFIDKIMRENEYSFCPNESLCKKTCLEILSNINLIRLNDTLPIFSSSNDDKISDLKSIINEYKGKLDKYNLYDECKVYTKAIEILEGGYEYILSDDEDVSLVFFNDKRCSLEKHFFNVLSNNVKKEFTSIEPVKFIKEKATNVNAVKCFGIYNEIDYVNNDIAKNKYRFGDVEILYTSDEMLPYIRSIFGENGIATNVVSAYSALGNKYLRLIIDIAKFAMGGFVYEDLKKVCFNRTLNIKNIGTMFLNGIGWGIGFKLSQYKSFVEKVRNYKQDIDGSSKDVELFNSGYIDFIDDLIKTFDVNTFNVRDIYTSILKFADKYTKDQSLDKNRIKAKLEGMVDDFAYVDSFSDLNSLLEYLIEELEDVKIVDEEDNSAITVKKLDGFFIVNRKHVYIVGLSSKHYDISTTESPVLSDEEREKYFILDKGSVSLKRNAMIDNENEIMRTIKCLDAGTLTFSMSDYSTLEFMPLAESSLYKKLCSIHRINDKDIKKMNAYNHIVDKDYKFNVDRIISKNCAKDTEESDDETLAKPTDAGYIDTSDKKFEIMFSKSSLDNFKDCILRYHYSKEAHINEEQYASPKEDVWLEANERGTFAHSVLEKYVNECLIDKKVSEKVNVDKLNEIFEEVKETTIAEHPIDSECIAEDFLSDCKNKILIYLERLQKELSSKDNKWKILATEQYFGYNDVECIKEYSINDKIFIIRYNGYIDRVDGYEDKDGKLHVRLIDYKTGSKGNFAYEHTTQHHIYSLFYNKDNIVDEFRYEFIFDEIENEGDGVIVISGSDMQDPIEHFNLKDKLYDVFVKHNYDIDAIDDSYEGGDICKYCNYKDICLKKIK